MKQLSILDRIEYTPEPDTFISAILGFDEFGRSTARTEVEGIPYFVNEFWTAKQRKAHSLHEISYRACFKAQLPEFFIRRLTCPGEKVHDPFMGRGTTLVQAALMGRHVSGVDINPLSKLLVRPRLEPISLHEVRAALGEIVWEVGRIEREDLFAFYHPQTLKRLEALRGWLRERTSPDSEIPDTPADWIQMVAINRLSGHSSGFFSGRSMPPNQAVSIDAQLRINQKLGADPPQRNVSEVILKKSRSLLRDGCAPAGVHSDLYTDVAWSARSVEDSAVDLVVTSPPFLDIVHYAADNWLRCWFAGIEPTSVDITMHRSEDAWVGMVHETLREQARILRSGGYVVFEVGEVRRGKVLLERLVWRAAEGLPFERLGVMINDQQFTKTANCWGVANGTKGTNTNRIVLFYRT